MMNPETIQDHVIHHAANLAAITIPVMSISLHAPEALSYTTAGLGIAWYVILIGERVCSWIMRWRAKK